MHLLTCGRVAAGSVPGWCCRKWRPEWGWCCTHPPPLPSCRCLSGRAVEPAPAAASLPWSLTGWRPWHWRPGRREWRRARCHVRKFNLIVGFALGQVDSEEKPLQVVLTGSNPHWAHSHSELRRDHHLLLLLLYSSSAPERQNRAQLAWSVCREIIC